jgi:alkylated DNA nucleotide flippase Atl1
MCPSHLVQQCSNHALDHLHSAVQRDLVVDLHCKFLCALRFAPFSDPRLAGMPILKCKAGSRELPGGEQLSPYEKQREANIQRNQEVMVSLGLEDAQGSALEEPVAAPARQSRKRVRDAGELASPSPARRSARGQATLEAELSTSPTLSPSGHQAAAAAPPAPRALRLQDSARAAGSSTHFAQRVLDVVRIIPRGKVASYGQVAAWAGSPNSARQVGKLLSIGLAAGDEVPWQRVINASGGISLPPDAGGIRQPTPSHPAHWPNPPVALAWRRRPSCSARKDQQLRCGAHPMTTETVRPPSQAASAPAGRGRQVCRGRGAQGCGRVTPQGPTRGVEAAPPWHAALFLQRRRRTQTEGPSRAGCAGYAGCVPCWRGLTGLLGEPQVLVGPV